MMSNREIVLVWLVAALGSGILGAWFADRYKHNAPLWAAICFFDIILGPILFYAYGTEARTSFVVSSVAAACLSSLIGMFVSWFCVRVARKKGRSEQFWAVIGFLFPLPAFIIISILSPMGPPQRPPLPKRPRSHDDDEESAED